MKPAAVPPARPRRRAPVIRYRRVRLMLEDHFDDQLRQVADTHGLSREALAAQIIRDNLIARRLS
jgi:predicted DNA-binding ribbon-helix-helix protein